MQSESALRVSQQNKRQGSNRTVIDDLQRCAERFPDKIAVVDGNSKYTFKQLSQLVDRVALGLLELGVQQGDVISCQLPNWNEFVILHFACSRLGVITNPLIPIYRDREIRYMVERAKPKLLVIADSFRGFDYTEMVNRIQADWTEPPRVLVVGDQIPEGMAPFDMLLKQPWEQIRDLSILDEFQVDPSDVTEIVFTSGTTGDPKGVLHTHNSLTSAAYNWIDRLSVTADDTLFMASTFAHQTGFIYGVRMMAHVGATAIYQDVWDPVGFARHVHQDKVTLTMGATPFLYDFVHLPGLEQYDTRSLRAFVTSGAPVPPALVREAHKKLSARVVTGWGMTETGMTTSTLLTDTDEKLTQTDGLSFEGMVLDVVDREGRSCPAGVEGNLRCCGPSLFVGYLNAPEITAENFSGHWFLTGDRAVIDADGYIRICGRTKDLVIRGGENIPVTYVENVLHEHPSIAVAQIVAMPDVRLQERACAFISLKPNCPSITLQDMQAFLGNKGITKRYWPERLEIVAEFPRTPSGKIQKFRLRTTITEMLSEGNPHA